MREYYYFLTAYPTRPEDRLRQRGDKRETGWYRVSDDEPANADERQAIGMWQARHKGGEWLARRYPNEYVDEFSYTGQPVYRGEDNE